ncbi:hypothetical protein [Streptomyces sp. NPDC102360]|uniref:hypothetical protein n=1 Tax=Streptomyces sp. NPDC102360 TaxID=3366160 RepID=UPI003805DA87
MPSVSDVLRKAAVGAVAAHLTWEAVTLARARRTARTALKKAPPVDDAGNAVLHLLVPGLREQPYVQRTVEAFAAVRDRYPYAHIWFVTTARELGEGPTTRELLEKELAARDAARMAVIEDPRPVGNKASQLNWAVEHIEGQHIAGQRQRIAGPQEDGDPVWFGVFDFDSQPPPELAAWVAAEAAGEREPEVVQAVPLATGCLSGAPERSWPRAVVRVEALHQAVRSLGVERWKLDRAAEGRLMPQYLVGAGLFVRADVLREVGGFPYVDDVPLGYRLFLRRARFSTVPVLNRVDLPDTVSAHLASLKFIARGITTWPEVLRETRGVRAVDRWRLAGLGVADTAEITVLPWLAAALTPGVLLRGPVHERALFTAWWAFPLVQTAVMRRVLADEMNAEEWRVPAVGLVSAGLGRRFWRTFGAWRLGADAVRARLTGGQVAFGKADRAVTELQGPA